MERRDLTTYFFSPIAIVYCILLFVCQSLYNKPERCTGQKSSLFNIRIDMNEYYTF